MKALAFSLAIALVACSKAPTPGPDAAPAAKEVARPMLVPLVVAKGFSAPEGVAEGPDGAIYISNVGGGETDKDGAGWISKLSAGGMVIAERYIEGLDAPKGMAIFDGALYVADIDIVRVFDLSTGAAREQIPIPGAKFLNDVAAWRGGVYISDSGTARIWTLVPEGPLVWREGTELNGVNGLLGVGDKMYISTMSAGALYEATSDGGWRQLASGLIDADGIGVAPSSVGGGFLVSSWPGVIRHVAPDGSVATLLDTQKEGVLQNDLTIIGDTVIVPNWEPGSVTFWRLDKAH